MASGDSESTDYFQNKNFVRNRKMVIDIAIEEIIDKLYLNVLNMIINTMK